ncbi:hypothetical protein LY76DRAFT_137217 [Colletotrichum caudatum]|nr:hypothetical protein LY76DRAFT_137217 [Colletotrichum caudatum]
MASFPRGRHPPYARELVHLRAFGSAESLTEVDVQAGRVTGSRAARRLVTEVRYPRRFLVRSPGTRMQGWLQIVCLPRPIQLVSCRSSGLLLLRFTWNRLFKRYYWAHTSTDYIAYPTSLQHVCSRLHRASLGKRVGVFRSRHSLRSAADSMWQVIRVALTGTRGGRGGVETGVCVQIISRGWCCRLDPLKQRRRSTTRSSLLLTLEYSAESKI